MILLIIIPVLLVVYIAFCSLKAKVYVADLPRDTMFMCDVHGPVSSKRTLKLDILTGKPQEYCSLCFHDRMKAAKKGELGK